MITAAAGRQQQSALTNAIRETRRPVSKERRPADSRSKAPVRRESAYDFKSTRPYSQRRGGYGRGYSRPARATSSFRSSRGRSFFRKGFDSFQMPSLASNFSYWTTITKDVFCAGNNRRLQNSISECSASYLSIHPERRDSSFSVRRREFRSGNIRSVRKERNRTSSFSHKGFLLSTLSGCKERGEDVLL